MQIGEKIKNYRKTAGLTQEQVADYLDVSTPAVNKWEKGNTYPDISLLPAIARLLKIDMNELFSFREELTEKEIGQFVNELSEVSLDSFIKAFEMGKNKIKEYPHCDSLIYSIATVLNAALTLSDVDDEKKLECNNVIVEWLERTAESPNEKVSISSIFMLAAKYIQMEKYKEANIFLDKIPDTVIDATIMKTNVLAHQEGTDIAAFFLEGKLMQTVTNIQNYLYKLIEMEEETGNHCKAEEIAEITEHMVSLFGLWDYGKVVPYLLIAVYRKDVEKCIQLIKEVLMDLIHLMPIHLFHLLPETRNAFAGGSDIICHRRIPQILPDFQKFICLYETSSIKIDLLERIIISKNLKDRCSHLIREHIGIKYFVFL